MRRRTGRGAFTLPLPTADLEGLRRKVRLLAEQRPAVYRMVDASGQVLYVGKAKRLRGRLQSYFHARFPEDKAARILRAAHDITWDYVPSEFAAHLGELRDIRRWRPPYNIAMNRRRNAAFLAILESRAPKLAVTASTTKDAARYYGPLPSPARAQEAMRVLNDLLGLRDCADRMPIAFAGQGDLFEAPRQAGCARYELGTCSGPCTGLVTERDYRDRVAAAAAFLEGVAIAPIDRIVTSMVSASDRGEFEAAARWRERFEAMEWLLGATTRARAAVDLLTFVYRDTGAFGDDRVYLIRQGLVRASYPWPETPIEEAAFRAVVEGELVGDAAPAPLQAGQIDEVLLVMSWFRRHPEAMRRTQPLDLWRDRAAA